VNKPELVEQVTKLGTTAVARKNYEIDTHQQNMYHPSWLHQSRMFTSLFLT